jgi:2-desacetyl-2-hydroxyethyl bacteriochlorophyllide A dehydrogenase
VAVHDVRRADLQEGERALVVGGGPIGLLVACVARARGADVVVAELSESRREFADGIGLRTVDPSAVDMPALVDGWSEGAGADVAFEVSGAAAGIETAIQSLAVRGRLACVAIHSTPPPVNLFRVFWRELTLIGARVYERADFTEAVRLLEKGAIPAADLITAVEPLERVAAAFAELENGSAMKVLINCNEGN